MSQLSKNGPFLWVALDGLVQDELGTFAVMDKLEKVEGDFGFKVGGDYLLKRSAKDARARLSSRPAFADVKMWSSTAVMERSFHVLHDAGFEATNAYALAGEGLGKAITAFRRNASSDSRLRIYTLTILTHYDDAYCNRMFLNGLSETVVRLALEGLNTGADGIIMPGTALSVVDAALSACYCSSLTKIVPGIRQPGEFNGDRQKQRTRPEEIAGRTDIEAVVGEPIMGSDDPVAALEQMLKVLQG